MKETLIGCPLLVMAKAPIAGAVKTRLIPILGDEGAARLHERLVEHTLQTALASGIMPVQLCCAPDCEHPFFRACAQRFGVDLAHQGTGDLGKRMYRTLLRAIQRHGAAVLVGTDCPSLTAGDFQAAAHALQLGNDAVFNPAEDGGYVLIGVRRLSERLFDAIAWGTGSVMATTRERLQALGWHWTELPTRWDVDWPEDYERLQREGLMSEDRATQ
jgi:rSAM/selenodomain-associated transferase 1